MAAAVLQGREQGVVSRGPHAQGALADEHSKRAAELTAHEAQVVRLQLALAALGVGAPAAHDVDEVGASELRAGLQELELGKLLEDSAHVLERERMQLAVLNHVALAGSVYDASSAVASTLDCIKLESAHVEVASTETRTDATGKLFTAFGVRVRAAAQREWLVHRRFREFEALNLALVHAGVALTGAALPTKAVLQPRSARVVEARAAQLNGFLAALVAQRCSQTAGSELPPSALRALRAFFLPGGEHISDQNAALVRRSGVQRLFRGGVSGGGSGDDDAAVGAQGGSDNRA